MCPCTSRERIQWKWRQSAIHPHPRHQMEVTDRTPSAVSLKKNAGTNYAGSWVRPTDCLDVLKIKKKNCSLQDSNNGTLSCSSI